MTNSEFTGNQAKKGGAVALKCSVINGQVCSNNLDSSVFNSNEASSSGGAIYYDSFRPSTTGSTFSSNKAEYGPNFASFPIRISKISSRRELNSSLDIKIENGVSGQPVSAENELKLGLFDQDEQIMNLDSSSSL
jgi:predicted outer membrane repeat protein